MPASRLGALAAVLLLGLLLLLELPPVTGARADKPGVCPQLPADLNCTQECSADQDCPENLKCCRAGCSAICSIPNGNPGAKGGFLPQHRLPPARHLPGPVSGGQPVSRQEEMLPQWLREGVLRHAQLLSPSHRQPEEWGADSSFCLAPGLAPAQRPPPPFWAPHPLRG